LCKKLFDANINDFCIISASTITTTRKVIRLHNKTIELVYENKTQTEAVEFCKEKGKYICKRSYEILVSKM
jgi:hypothetical protein